MSVPGSSAPKAPRTYVPSNLRRVTLPASEKPQQWDADGFELDETGQRRTAVARTADGRRVQQEPKALLSIEESLVLLQSLQQSRQHHIQELFPIFTTPQTSRPKANSKVQVKENTTPKHDIKLIGKCTLEVGPISFQDVSLWECRFLEYQHPIASPMSQSIDQTPPAINAKSKAKNILGPAVLKAITDLSNELPWLSELVGRCGGSGATEQSLKLLGNVVDYMAAGLPLPPPLPNGDPPILPPLPPATSVVRPRATGQCWRLSKDKAPLLLLSFKENPATKFVIPVQLSLISYSRQNGTTISAPTTANQQVPQDGNDTMSISMFLPCRGWGKWENAPDLTRNYRTITTRRKQGNVYPESSPGHKMLRPLPVDPKSDFGPIGGISIPAGLLEPVSIGLTGMASNTCARVRVLAREIENFDNQGEADVTLSSRSTVGQNTSTQKPSISPAPNVIVSTKDSGTVAQSPAPSLQKSPQNRTNESLTQSERRSRRSETRGLDEGRNSSTPPAGPALDRPLGDKPWKVQLFERLLKRVPKRAFLQCRVASPVPSEIANAAMVNNPSTPVTTDLTKKAQNGKGTITNEDGPQISNSSRKRKAPESEATVELETTITLDTLEASILKRVAEPLVVDDTLQQPKRIHKPAFDNTTPCQGCGRVGVKIWRVGPNGNATLCDKCGDKMKDGTLGKVVAPNGSPSHTAAVDAPPTPNAGHVAPRPTGHPQSLPFRDPDQNQPVSSASATLALERQLPTHLEHSNFVPSVLQPGPRAGSGPELQWNAHNQGTSEASTSILPSHPHRSSQTLHSGPNGVHRLLPAKTRENQGPETHHAFGSTNAGPFNSTTKGPQPTVMTPQAGPSALSVAPSSATQHAIGPANSRPSSSTLPVSVARGISPQIGSSRPAVVPSPGRQHVSGSFSAASSNSAPKVLPSTGMPTQFRPPLPFATPSPATQRVSSTANSGSFDLAMQMPKSTGMTPQVAPPLPSATPSPRHGTNAGSPGHLYHEPQAISGYIAPRKILPSTVVQSPSIGFRQSPQPGSPRAPQNMPTPGNASVSIPPAGFRPVQAPTASGKAVPTVGSTAPNVRPPGSPAGLRPEVSSVATTSLSGSGFAKSNSNAHNGVSPLLALAVTASEAAPSVPDGRQDVPHIPEPSTSIQQ